MGQKDSMVGDEVLAKRAILNLIYCWENGELSEVEVLVHPIHAITCF